MVGVLYSLALNKIEWPIHRGGLDENMLSISILGNPLTGIDLFYVWYFFLSRNLGVTLL